jgi:predicted AAA+ superfamily ATPase
MISRIFNPLIYLEKHRSVLLLGPRGTGKTALISSILSGARDPAEYDFISIDLLQGGDFKRYVGNPEQLTKEVLALEQKSKAKSLIVIIDEVQKIPSLLDEVHHLIESSKGRVVFLLSGSSARKLRRGGANLLAGRALSCQYYPLNILEVDLDLDRALRFGTMPAVYLDPSGLEVQSLESYVSTYLREEIQQEALVRGVERFAKFLEFAGQQNGQPINFAKLGRSIGIPGKTVADYYGILSDTLLTTELPGWSESVKRQLLQAPRYYFFDCGVLNAINGYLRVELRHGGYLYGNLFETFVLNQLVAANSYLSKGFRFFYWRDKDGHEVDLLLARNQFEPLLAIEIKSGTAPKASDCPGFTRLSEDYPNIRKICACNSPRSYFDQEIEFLPWKSLVQEIQTLGGN